MTTKKNTFLKKVLASTAVATFLVSGTVISGFAGYVQVGNTLKNFALRQNDSTSFGLGYVPGGTQIDQIESYPTIILSAYDYSHGCAYARTSSSQSTWGWDEYYIQKNNPSPYTFRYKNVPAGTCVHYWSNWDGGGFRTNLTVYRYTD